MDIFNLSMMNHGHWCSSLHSCLWECGTSIGDNFSQRDVALHRLFLKAPKQHLRRRRCLAKEPYYLLGPRTYDFAGASTTTTRTNVDNVDLFSFGCWSSIGGSGIIIISFFYFQSGFLGVGKKDVLKTRTPTVARGPSQKSGLFSFCCRRSLSHRT